MQQVFSEWLCMVKTAELWFHSAHHLVKGAGFSGDHVGLYGMIYTELQEEFDAVAERVLGLTDKEELLCPKHITSTSIKLLEQYPSPANMSSLDIALAAHKLVLDYCIWENNFHTHLDDLGLLTIGLDDLLSGNASNHEKYAYLLQQRVKEL
jgi:DNA-binding ferritin-like protein